jgi:hypothetical protein
MRINGRNDHPNKPPSLRPKTGLFRIPVLVCPISAKMLVGQFPKSVPQRLNRLRKSQIVACEEKARG